LLVLERSQCSRVPVCEIKLTRMVVFESVRDVGGRWEVVSRESGVPPSYELGFSDRKFAVLCEFGVRANLVEALFDCGALPLAEVWLQRRGSQFWMFVVVVVIVVGR
jgi:hypothetical protein